MPFGEWYESDLWRHGFGHKGLLEEAWQAATRAERERCCALIASICTDPGIAEQTTAYLVGQSCIKQIMDGITLQE